MNQIEITSSAKFSPCRRYRYNLWRRWADEGEYCMFIGLNPSTADETEDDATIRRCITYAKDWGFSALCMANLFAFCTKNPSEMKKAERPIGDGNNAILKGLARKAGIVVAAWGNNGRHLNRSSEVRKLIPNLHYLKLNKSGEPAHPLYLKKTLKPIPFDLIT